MKAGEIVFALILTWIVLLVMSVVVVVVIKRYTDALSDNARARLIIAGMVDPRSHAHEQSLKRAAIEYLQSRGP